MVAHQYLIEISLCSRWRDHRPFGRHCQAHLQKFLSAFRLSCISLYAGEEQELDGSHLFVIYNVNASPNTITSYALINYGATEYAFIDKQFAVTHLLSLYPYKQGRTIEVIDGRPMPFREVTHVTKVGLVINRHTENLLAFITILEHYPIVLRKLWL